MGVLFVTPNYILSECMIHQDHPMLFRAALGVCNLKGYLPHNKFQSSLF